MPRALSNKGGGCRPLTILEKPTMSKKIVELVGVEVNRQMELF
jgi:hypothetical protein